MTDRISGSDRPKSPASDEARPAPFGFILLAAGASIRMGQPKQLLIYRGTPLIVRAAEGALAAGASPVIVVLGARAREIRPVLQRLAVTILQNDSWEDGMGSSIRVGIDALWENFPPVKAVALGVCDQPHFSPSVVLRLLEVLGGDKTIACARYAGRLGVPAIFHARHFGELRKLRGKEGARELIIAHDAETAGVDLPELAMDLDLPEDYQRLLAQDQGR